MSIRLPLMFEGTNFISVLKVLLPEINFKKQREDISFIGPTVGKFDMYVYICVYTVYIVTFALPHVGEVSLRPSVHRCMTFPLSVARTLNHATDVLLLKMATFYKGRRLGCEDKTLEIKKTVIFFDTICWIA